MQSQNNCLKFIIDSCEGHDYMIACKIFNYFAVFILYVLFCIFCKKAFLLSVYLLLFYISLYAA